MSATNETANYKLPLFVDNDQPTWLGDFNGAMNKIDADMNTSGANASTALSAANNAVNRIGQVETTVASVQNTANNALSLAHTNEADISTIEADISTIEGEVAALNNKFPIASGNIATAAVTAEKLDSTAINAVWTAQHVYHFDSNNTHADNVGISVPRGCRLAGYYFTELSLLLLTSVYFVSSAPTNATMTLPSYVPIPNGGITQSIGVIHWTASEDFHKWGRLDIAKGTRVISVTSRDDGVATDLNGTVMLYMGTTQNSSAAAYAKANGLL